MSFTYKNINQHTSAEVNDPQESYEKAEKELLLEGLKRSHQERLFFATMLYKVQQTFNKATIIHRPDNLRK